MSEGILTEEISKVYLLIEGEGNHTGLRQALDTLYPHSGHEVWVVCELVDNTVVGGDIRNLSDGCEPGGDVRDISV